jgi:simple sugar transport system substrate-binding protein/basic membrane protein A
MPLNEIWRRPRTALITAGVLAATVTLGACGSGSGSGSNSGSDASSGGQKLTVGFIMVGSNKDAGYNEAVYDASQTLGKDMSNVKVVTANNIPETNAVTQTMQSMVNNGAKVIFATSYGYFSYALAFAKAHPDVTVLHQGGFQDGSFPKNFGTYWGKAYEPVSLGGMAAGAATKSNTLGFVYAFPINQTITNIDAFELGAQKTNPKAKTILVNTSNWCDPIKQKEAAQALIGQGADVLSQHQDCQSTVIQAAKAAGKKIVGYHYDAKSLDPDGWLTGSAWNWAPVYEAITNTVIAGTFTGSKYNANWIGSFANNDNPLELASFGSSVSSDTQSQIKAAEADLKKPNSSIFAGPIYCQDGSLMVPAGHVPTDAEVQAFKCLVKGVVGSLPKS